MYHMIVSRIIRGLFKDLSAGEYSRALRSSRRDVHHIFAGEHAIGGERYDREAFRLWFERLFRLFPSIQFKVHDVIVKGWPWNTIVAVEWSADVTPASGPQYKNQGVHIIHLKWGRTSLVHAYEDSQAVVDACNRMAAAGIEEASAPPITNP